MARYDAFQYGQYTYGGGRGLTRSGLLATATDYGQITVGVLAPERVGATYYLIRTYNGAAEHPLAGLIVQTGTVVSTEFTVVDGVDNYTDSLSYNNIALTPGWVYYTLYIVDSTGAWAKDAATSVLLPFDRGTADYLLNAIPSVYTSADQNPITPIEPDSDLSRFLSGFTLTYDELASSVDSILPDTREKQVIRRLHPAYSEGRGMPAEYTIGTASSARLFREAGYIYRNKGTLSGIQTYVEALTGWQAAAYASTNRFLSLDDSSFEYGTGNWGVTGGTLTRQVVLGGVTAAEAVYPYEYPTGAWKTNAVGEVELTAVSATMSLPATTDVLKYIPVTAGQTYRVTVPVRATVGTPTVRADIKWLTQEGTLISTHTPTAFTTSGSWVEKNTTAVAPATAVFAALSFVVAGTIGDAVHLDMLSFSDTADYISGAFAYRDPASVTVICDPVRTNLVKNASFDIDTSQWALDGATSLTRSTAQAYFGVSSGLVVSPVEAYGVWTPQGTSGVPVTPGLQYTVSAQIRGLVGTRTNAVGIFWYDALGAYISGVHYGNAVSGATWKTSSLTMTAPATAAFAAVTVRPTVTGTAGDSFYFDAVTLEQADYSPVFFSGTVSDSTGTDATYVGTPGASYSVLYPNRLVKLARLIETMDYYIPFGSTWRVLLWDSADPQAVAKATALS